MSFEQRMTKRIWGLDWAKILPWTFEGATVEYGTFAEAEPFIQDVFPRTFNAEGRWLVEPMTEAKRRFAEEMDVFLFRSEERVVGLLAGHPSDWATYYWRSVVMHPDHRAGGLLTSFAERCYAYFAEAGVARMEVDTCPGNPVTMRFFPSQGFIVTSTISSERWGFSVRFTKFLDDAAARIYQSQFLDIPVIEKKERIVS